MALDLFTKKLASTALAATRRVLLNAQEVSTREAVKLAISTMAGGTSLELAALSAARSHLVQPGIVAMGATTLAMEVLIAPLVLLDRHKGAMRRGQRDRQLHHRIPIRSSEESIIIFLIFLVFPLLYFPFFYFISLSLRRRAPGFALARGKRILSVLTARVGRAALDRIVRRSNLRDGAMPTKAMASGGRQSMAGSTTGDRQEIFSSLMLAALAEVESSCQHR